jgi:hypothetical protein
MADIISRSLPATTSASAAKAGPSSPTIATSALTIAAGSTNLPSPTAEIFIPQIIHHFLPTASTSTQIPTDNVETT